MNIHDESIHSAWESVYDTVACMMVMEICLFSGSSEKFDSGVCGVVSGNFTTYAIKNIKISIIRCVWNQKVFFGLQCVI